MAYHMESFEIYVLILPALPYVPPHPIQTHLTELPRWKRTMELKAICIWPCAVVTCLNLYLLSKHLDPFRTIGNVPLGPIESCEAMYEIENI